MITVTEIRKKAERLFPEVLKAALAEEPFFPRSIRADKSLSQDFAQMSKEIAAVMAHSKERKGYGYSVHYQSRKTRQHGYQDIPSDIVFESLADYLKFLQKENEYEAFLEEARKIEVNIPQLHYWMISNPLGVVANTGNWDGLLKVCDWFLNRFEANTYYIRELPIAVHTKFIEENRGVIRSLLETLIPEKLDLSETLFEKRLRLKYSLPIIRYRSGPNVLQEIMYTDISVPLDQFVGTPLCCKAVFVIENLMNFLTFPLGGDDIVIWGKGFAIESLKEVSWLSEKHIFCWSDLDAQGFQMLSQLRSYFPKTASFLMDNKTLELFKEFAVTGTTCNIDFLEKLSADEHLLFEFLARDNLRLEQERIPQWYVIKSIEEL